jgi:hypothetical protein
MTREQQQALDRRYADWHKVYHEEVYDRATHWGDSHKSLNKKTIMDEQTNKRSEGEL